MSIEDQILRLMDALDFKTEKEVADYIGVTTPYLSTSKKKKEGMLPCKFLVLNGKDDKRIDLNWIFYGERRGGECPGSEADLCLDLVRLRAQIEILQDTFLRLKADLNKK